MITHQPQNLFLMIIFFINSISSNLEEEIKDIFKLSLDGKDTNKQYSKNH
jgi:hypothetical protein